MSEDNEEVDDTSSSCCASCGIAEIDDVKLVPCDNCDLVRYCSDACQRDHKSEHEETCKKRAAELRDEMLFKQPESTHMGDCPICCLPIPLDKSKSTLQRCCSKFICYGCAFGTASREFEMRLQHSCPFCRTPEPTTEVEGVNRNMKRIEANDPVAIFQEGATQQQKGYYRSAFDYFTKAAELGNTEAHFHLAVMYHNGEGVEQNKGKEIFHLEEATIGGQPMARHNLAFNEWEKGNFERAVKHWIIAATLGFDESMKELMRAFKRGECSKDELASALRAHKAAADETKSPQRSKAEEYRRFRRNWLFGH